MVPQRDTPFLVHPLEGPFLSGYLFICDYNSAGKRSLVCP